MPGRSGDAAAGLWKLASAGHKPAIRQIKICVTLGGSLQAHPRSPRIKHGAHRQAQPIENRRYGRMQSCATSFRAGLFPVEGTRLSAAESAGRCSGRLKIGDTAGCNPALPNQGRSSQSRRAALRAAESAGRCSGRLKIGDTAGCNPALLHQGRSIPGRGDPTQRGPINWSMQWPIENRRYGRMQSCATSGTPGLTE